ncbi:hypothetical protein [Streptomyces marincola]|uniref:hypothetical protein n=1 Tax=Streptomyces marincola TaxID=2878388 RepID=UPI001CF3CA07|nr:hypothetical protein [Streptomyces marincola]UCM91490.1 hypothetical protein LC193_28030 [Streptomyces marincola]
MTGPAFGRARHRRRPRRMARAVGWVADNAGEVVLATLTVAAFAVTALYLALAA